MTEEDQPHEPATMTATQESVEHLALRRTLAYRLRTERHLTFAAIARSLQTGTVDPATGEQVVFEISPQTARKDYWHVLKENGYVTDPAEVELQRAEELQKCEALEAAYMPQALKGDTRCANVVMRAMRIRHSLLGLSQVAITGPGGGPIQLQVAIPDDALVALVADARQREAEAAPSMN